MLIGTFVFTKKTAPILRRPFTKAPSLSKPLVSPSQLTYPQALAIPSMLNLSFMLTGKPCNGPIVRPFASRYSSSHCARSSAATKHISDKQFVYKTSQLLYKKEGMPRLTQTSWCASAARWQNARVTSREVHSSDRIFSSILLVGLSVISISNGCRNLQI